MKNYLCKPVAALALLLTILLGACDNPVSPAPRAAVPEGKGLVRVETGAAAARTAVPAVNFARYEYWFAKEDDDAAQETPVAGVFELEAGSYTVTVKAFVSAGDMVPATEGASESFTITAGADAGVVKVVLTPVIGAGAGALNFNLAFPGAAEATAFTLTRVGGTESFNLLAAGTPGTGTLAGTQAGIGAGYWLARVSLQKDGVYAGRSEVAHIYEGMATELSWTFAAEVFAAIPVTSAADSGPGTLREALERANAGQGGKIFIDLPAGSVITTGFLAIAKDLVIEGNGATLKGGFLFNNVPSAQVTIRRLHFTGNKYNNGSGAAIRGAINEGGLALESCIFSDNQTTGNSSNGGAIYFEGSLTVRGCTFYGNRTTLRGGAINVVGPLVLTGNLFYENGGSSVVYGASLSSGGGNVSDKSSALSGWSSPSDHYETAGILISPVSFRPLADSAALNVIADPPPNYPATDFYGAAIAAGAASGAAQTPTAAGYYLGYGVTDMGTVSPYPLPDADGLYQSGAFVELTAEANTGWVFSSWTINGSPAGSANPLTLQMDAHKTVRAIFTQDVTVSDEAGLRAALTAQGDGDIIRFGANITLASGLPNITKNIAIEGNGHTLTRTLADDMTAPLLSINSQTATVSVRRLRFKDGLSSVGGAIILRAGNLALESCVFSGNQATSVYNNSYNRTGGGALYIGDGSVYVRACTFYRNTAPRSTGGAICSSDLNKGTVALMGNLFVENTAFTDNIVGGPGLISGGGNVSDLDESNSGYTFYGTDEGNASFLISAKSYKPLADSAALGKLPAALPADYPTVDFYGAAITGSGASGAVQTPAAPGFALDHVATGPGHVAAEVKTGTLDEDDVYSSGATVALTASGDGGTFSGWTVNGVPNGSDNPLSLVMEGHKTVRALFLRSFTASDEASLRAALEDQADGDIINFSPGLTISLAGALPEITKSIVIEGNGATLTQDGLTASLLRIAGEVTVSISRLHLKGGRASDKGGGIYTTPGVYLILKSCVFSDNQSSSGGGAIYADSNNNTIRKTQLTVLGCTFFNNNGGSGRGGAMWLDRAAASLTGNIFLQNIGTNPGDGYIIRSTGGVLPSTGGYNVSDKASGNSGLRDSGWTFAGTDLGEKLLTITPANFKPPSDSAALNRLPYPLPDGYPTLDFYGVLITAGGASGAAQTPLNGYLLDHGFTGGPGRIDVEVKSGTVDQDGAYSEGATVELRASSEAPGWVFYSWTIDGSPAGSANPLTLQMDASKTVRAIFTQDVTVSDEAGLRAALTAQGDGDIIRFGADISLAAVLPNITKSITIEGNGHTLTRTFAGGTSSNLFYIDNSTVPPIVTIRRLHFKGGLAQLGGALRNYNGTLTVESCIFSGNEANGTNTTYDRGGGAILNSGSLTVLGCTFYNNTVAQTGGAILCTGGSVALTGNLFIGNIAGDGGDFSAGNVVYGDAITSGGYNVSDRGSGLITSKGDSDRAASGYEFSAGDVGLATDVTLDANFKPRAVTTNLKTLVTLPAEFPATYFDGTPREGAHATAGAVKAD